MSAIPTSGNCSILLLMTVSANSLNSMNFSSPALSSVSVIFSRKTGISVALAFIILGLSRSRGRLFMAPSIFSFTSMKARLTSLPNLNLSLISALPLRDSD